MPLAASILAICVTSISLRGRTESDSGCAVGLTPAPGGGGAVCGIGFQLSGAIGGFGPIGDGGCVIIGCGGGAPPIAPGGIPVGGAGGAKFCIIGCDGVPGGGGCVFGGSSLNAPMPSMRSAAVACAFIRRARSSCCVCHTHFSRDISSMSACTCASERLR